MRFPILVALVLTTGSSISLARGGDHHRGEHHGDGRHHDDHHSSDDSSHHADRHDENHKVTITGKSENLDGTVTIGVAGMMCSSCREKLEAAVKGIPEVSAVSADVKTKTMTVTLKSTIPRARLEKVMIDAGFNPR